MWGIWKNVICIQKQIRRKKYCSQLVQYFCGLLFKYRGNDLVVSHRAVYHKYPGAQLVH